jgi:hypothetical protein
MAFGPPIVVTALTAMPANMMTISVIFLEQAFTPEHVTQFMDDVTLTLNEVMAGKSLFQLE